MSVFSEHLSHLVEERKEKVASLGKYCGVDRSTMYQYMNGKRNVPSSMELVNKIAGFFHLTPIEYEKLKEAYFITKTGEDVYYRRKSVENFIKNFPDPLFEASKSGESEKTDILTGKKRKIQNAAISTQVELNQYLHQILLEEALKEEGKIALFLPADYGFLFDLLASLKPIKTLEIRHILCMSSTGQRNEENELYSLEYLKMLLPMYVGNLDYQPYYFYDDINSHFYNLNGMPCLILTSEYAITCTSDYQMGILYESSDVISMFWNLFASYQDHCQKLFEVVKMIPGNDQIFQEVITTESPCYVLQPEPCLTPFITEEILRNVLSPKLPDHENMIPLILELFSRPREVLDVSDTCISFTQKGLEHFVNTGKVKEIPDVFYEPFSPENRVKIMEAMLPYCQKGVYRILNIHNHLTHGEIPVNFHLCVNGNLGYFLFTNISGENVRLIIREQSILEAFQDYLENLEDKYFLSEEETTALVENEIKKLKCEEKEQDF